MGSKFTIDGDAVRVLATILADTDLTEIEYEDNGRRVRLSRGSNTQAAQLSYAMPYSGPIPSPIGAAAVETSPPASAIAPLKEDLSKHVGVVSSPMVGTAYVSSEPGAAPFVKVGDTITEGKTFVIIEAMKVMNPIKAQRSGKVIHIFMKDGTPVEFGEPLIVIE